MKNTSVKSPNRRAGGVRSSRISSGGKLGRSDARSRASSRRFTERQSDLRANSEELSPSVRRHAPDYRIVVLMVLLIAFGAVIGYISSPGLTETQNLPGDFYTKKQFIAIALGAVAFGITSTVSISFWRAIIWPSVAAAVLVSVAVRLLGTPIYGAYRWLDLGGVSIQAAEIIKFALLLWLADFAALKRRSGELFNKDSMKTVGFVMLSMFAVVAVIQSDLGSAAVMTAMTIGILFVAGLPLKKLAIIGGAIVGVGFLVVVTSAYRIQRVQTFLNPSADCQDSGYQVCQALISVGSGGVAGRGLGRSVQAYGYLPEALSDSIFAVIAENAGFIGSAFLLFLFIDLFRRLYRISVFSSDEYNRYLVLGILMWLASQTAINIGAMVGLLPLKGITLPLISFGGTSIIFVMAALGICFNVSRYTDFRAVRASSNNGFENIGKNRRRARA